MLEKVWYRTGVTTTLKKNIMKHTEARDFREAVKQRARNIWINHEINRMIMFQYSNLKVWVSEDKNVMFYVDNPEQGGP